MLEGINSWLDYGSAVRREVTHKYCCHDLSSQTKRLYTPLVELVNVLSSPADLL